LAGKIIVTHLNPDLDAICSVWLLKKFDPDYKKAIIKLVAAGQTYKNLKPDEDENIVHVDTGLGKFDHHQIQKKTCAAQLVFNYLKSRFKHLNKDEALIRLIKVIRDIDNFKDCLWPNAQADYYDFNLQYVLDGLKVGGQLDDDGLIEKGQFCLNGIYTRLKIKVKAEADLKRGYEFESHWGKAVGVLSHNFKIHKIGLRQGYIIVVQKDVRTDHVRIKARPESKVDLTETRSKLKKLDPKATWFLHISKKMLLNGSTKNPKMKPSTLGLKKVIQVLSV
jgi:hypothetical protein